MANRPPSPSARLTLELAALVEVPGLGRVRPGGVVTFRLLIPARAEIREVSGVEALKGSLFFRFSLGMEQDASLARGPGGGSGSHRTQWGSL